MVDKSELGEFDLENFMSKSGNSENSAAASSEGTLRQIVFVIDASNSMQGHKIGAVNDCVNNIISKLRSLDRSRENPISIYVIGFASRLFKWTDSFVRASEFKYSYVEMADGLTDINAAIKELTVLTNNNMKKEAKKYVVLFSDGLSTENCSESMAQWSQAELYPEIRKIVAAFEDDLRDSQSMSFFESFAEAGLIVPITSQEDILNALLG